MTPVDGYDLRGLRDTIAAARSIVTRPGNVDRVAISLAQLADLASQRLVAQEALEDSEESGVEREVAERRYEMLDAQLRHVLPLPVSIRRIKREIGALGSELRPSPGWTRKVEAKLPVALVRENWLRRTWRWLWW